MSEKADEVYLLIIMTWWVIKTKCSVENSLMEKAKYTEHSFVRCTADPMHLTAWIPWYK